MIKYRTYFDKIETVEVLRETVSSVYVQTGSKAEAKDLTPASGTRFEVFRQVTGELRAAKRVDFTA